MTKKVVWTIIAVAAAALIGLFLFLFRAHRLREIAERLSVPIEGAVIQRETDPQKELPIADVVITASDGVEECCHPIRCVGLFQACTAQESIVRSANHGDFPPSSLRTAGDDGADGKTADAEPALCRRHGSARSSSSKGSCSPQPSGSAGLQYPGEVYDQHPHPDERG